MSERLLAEAAPHLTADAEITAGAERLVRAFEWLSLERTFGTPELRETVFRDADFPTYERFMMWANGVARQATPNERKLEPFPEILLIRDSEEPKAVATCENKEILYCPPDPEDRRELQIEAFTVAQQLDDLEAAATLMRLVNFLTHRNLNGNTRTSALMYSLLTHGYDGSPKDKAHYLTLLQGREGNKAVGMNVNPTFLNERFATHRAQRVADKMRYTGPLPTGVTPFRVGDLFDSRPDLFYQGLLLTGIYFAEQSMNIPVIMECIYQGGLDINEFITHDTDCRPILNMQRLFSVMSNSDVTKALVAHDVIKNEFISSITECFKGDETIYGPYKDLIARLRPVPVAAGQPTPARV